MTSRRRWHRHPLFLSTLRGVLLLALVGCVHPSVIAERRAHYDLDCPHAPVTMTTLAGDTFIARGCGRTAVYTCIDSAGTRALAHRWSCIKESAKKDADVR